MRNPKVLIGMDTCNKFAYAEEHVFKGIFSQTYKNYDFLVVDNSEDRTYEFNLKLKYPNAIIKHKQRPALFRLAVAQVRKYIIDFAVVNGYDYLFFVDADFIIKPDTLEKLLKHKADFATAVIGYLHNQDNKTTVCVGDPSRLSKVPGIPRLNALRWDEMDNPPFFMQITACGLSCCLVKTKFLINLDFYVSTNTKSFMEDFIFCRELRYRGAKLYLDKTLRPFHLHVQMLERDIKPQF